MAKPTPNHRSDYSAFSTITTRWFDNDVFGHMNNAMHYQLFDTAVNGYLIEQGLISVRNSPTVFLVVETGCSYFAEIAFPDVVTAGIKVARLGTTSVCYEIGLFRNDAVTAAAQGHFVHVHVDRNTHTPVIIEGRRKQILANLQR